METPKQILKLTISWKGERGGRRISTLEGYESVADARRQLKKRWPDVKFHDLPNGFYYEEEFHCRDVHGIQVFAITEPKRRGVAK